MKVFLLKNHLEQCRLLTMHSPTLEKKKNDNLRNSRVTLNEDGNLIIRDNLEPLADFNLHSYDYGLFYGDIMNDSLNRVENLSISPLNFGLPLLLSVHAYNSIGYLLRWWMRRVYCSICISTTSASTSIS